MIIYNVSIRTTLKKYVNVYRLFFKYDRSFDALWAIRYANVLRSVHSSGELIEALCGPTHALTRWALWTWTGDVSHS